MELSFVPITSNFSDMDKLNTLAKEAFPPEEYIAPDELIKMTLQDGLFFYAIYDRQIFVGFMVVMIHETMAYLFFLAIDSSQRSHGYGSHVLKEMHNLYPSFQYAVDMEMIDNEAENNSQRISRRNFYIRNGYEPTGYFISYFDVAYEILCYGGNFNVELFKKLISKIQIEGFNPHFWQE